MARVTTWRHTTWARWLGWTGVFALVAGACGLAYRGLRPEIPPAWSLALLVPPLVAAFLIGARFRSWSWALGPPMALLLAGTPLLLIPYAVVVPHTQGLPFPDLTYAEATFVAGLFLLLGVWITLVLYALVAAAGVWWGRRRYESDPSPPGIDGH
jgi:hypothetical protein